MLQKLHVFNTPSTPHCPARSKQVAPLPPSTRSRPSSTSRSHLANRAVTTIPQLSASARYQAQQAPQTHLHNMLHREPRPLPCRHTTMPSTTLISHSSLPAFFLKQLSALPQTPSTVQRRFRLFSILNPTGALPYLPPRPARRSCSTRRPLQCTLNPPCTLHSHRRLCRAAGSRPLHAPSDGLIVRPSPQRRPPGTPTNPGFGYRLLHNSGFVAARPSKDFSNRSHQPQRRPHPTQGVPSRPTYGVSSSLAGGYRSVYPLLLMLNSQIPRWRDLPRIRTRPKRIWSDIPLVTAPPPLNVRCEKRAEVQSTPD
jgi:hypothetical protein